MEQHTMQTLHNDWKTALKGEFSAPYMKQLTSFLDTEKAAEKIIFPSEEQYFHALNLTPPDKIRAVILGQDPYHGDGQAHGLAFSVNNNIRIPPSLRNIYKELQSDIGIAPAQHGCLDGWAKQGVLLLNTVLTVERGLAASHQGHGWEAFTDAIIGHINALNQPIVFMLWGSHAQKKSALLNNPNHLILKAPHPSPLSAHRGFFGCKHFSQANAFLHEHGGSEIDWRV